jgi:hypothetical protein
MLRKQPILALFTVVFLNGCGGGGGSEDDREVGIPAPPPAQLALTSANYSAATASAVRTASIAFDYARLSGETVAFMLDRPVNLLPNWPCRSGGTVSFELTDRNRNGFFNENDRLHIRLDHCVTDGTSVSGLIRIELQDVTQQSDGRDYELTFEMVDLAISTATPDVPARRFDFSGSVYLSRGANHEHWVLSFGTFDLREGDVRLTAGTLLLDYSQRYDLGTYEYLVQGDLFDSRLGGVARATTPASFTGTIGQFPTAGRLMLAGAANSAARVSEEGAAAGDAARVLIAVDANGDGTVDQENAGVPWSDLTYNVFGSLRDAADATLLPLRPGTGGQDNPD